MKITNDELKKFVETAVENGWKTNTQLDSVGVVSPVGLSPDIYIKLNEVRLHLAQMGDWWFIHGDKVFARPVAMAAGIELR